MRCAVQIYMVLREFHVYKSVFLGWVAGRFNIAVNGEHNCGVTPKVIIIDKYIINFKGCNLAHDSRSPIFFFQKIFQAYAKYALNIKCSKLKQFLPRAETIRCWYISGVND